jgi:N-acetylmuramic acid 6-phosphate etherase
MSSERIDLLATEAVRPDLRDLDQRTTPELVALMLGEQQAVDEALAQAADPIARAVDAMADRMRRGGRVLYLGAGTPGRLAALDAAECPPTFGIPAGLVAALPAGGADSLVTASEGSEDDADSAVRRLEAAGLRPEDTVVGISASGRTPYVVAGLTAARSAGALTVSVANNTGAAISALADVAIELPTGPELIAGSTRLKAGTAQKIVLGTLSTLVMVRLGRTYGNLMVDLQAGNVKLHDRARRIVAAATGCTPQLAAETLDAAEGSVKVAVVVLLAEVSAEEARDRLAGGASVREAVRG